MAQENRPKYKPRQNERAAVTKESSEKRCGNIVSYEFTGIRKTCYYTVFQKNGHPFCFCYKFASRDQILVIFGRLVAKEILNRILPTDLKEIAATYVRSGREHLRHCN